MKIKEVIKILDAKLYVSDNLNADVFTACGSDMMSDVLAFVKDQSILLTGLVNPQVVRTAEMMDMHMILFIRGKEPTEEIIELAQKRHIMIASTGYAMFEACGILYNNGIKGGNVRDGHN